MKKIPFEYLAILFSLTGIGVTAACLALIPGMPIPMYVILFLHFTIILIPALVMAWSYHNEKKELVAPHVFGPRPVAPPTKEKKKRQIFGILFLGFGPILASFCFLIHVLAGMMALMVFMAALFSIALLSTKGSRNQKSKGGQTEVQMYGYSAPIKFESYRFDEESLSKAAELLSASRVSELPVDMPYYDKVDRLAKDGSCVLFTFDVGLEAMLAGIGAVIARREPAAPEITMEAVFARDTEQIRNRRRDGQETQTSDLNVIARLLEDAGFILLDLLYHPYGHVITVVSAAEFGRLRELTYKDLKEMQKYRG